MAVLGALLGEVDFTSLPATTLQANGTGINVGSLGNVTTENLSPTETLILGGGQALQPGVGTNGNFAGMSFPISELGYTSAYQYSLLAFIFDLGPNGWGQPSSSVPVALIHDAASGGFTAGTFGGRLFTDLREAAIGVENVSPGTPLVSWGPASPPSESIWNFVYKFKGQLGTFLSRGYAAAPPVTRPATPDDPVVAGVEGTRGPASPGNGASPGSLFVNFRFGSKTTTLPDGSTLPPTCSSVQLWALEPPA